jgi:glycosyltransferase involved in cell wall biosynthesis
MPVVAANDRAYRDSMARRLMEHGVEVDRSATASTARIAVLEAAERLILTVTRRRPDVVHLHTEIPEFAWALASVPSRAVRSVPVVRTVHNTVLWGGWGLMGRFAERRLAAARIAAVSNAARSAFLDWRRSPARSSGDPIVIYNGVDLGHLPDTPRDLDRPPVLCFAGRFEHQKGIDVLLEAIEPLAASGPPFRLEIYGAGTYGARVAETAARSPNRITVSPPVPDLRDRLGSVDAVVMPSRFEGLPLLAVEALCIGVPILATNALGLDEVLPGWYPGRCPPGDPKAFGALLRDFLADPAGGREAAVRARPEARERFSLDAMVTAYERLYEEALGG